MGGGPGGLEDLGGTCNLGYKALGAASASWLRGIRQCYIDGCGVQVVCSPVPAGGLWASSLGAGSVAGGLGVSRVPQSQKRIQKLVHALWLNSATHTLHILSMIGLILMCVLLQSLCFVMLHKHRNIC